MMAGNTHKLSETVSFYSKSSYKSLKRLATEGADLDEQRMLFGPFVPEASLIHFPSPRGVGKSWFCMQLCVAIAAEWTSFLGETINRHGNTLYINFELSEKVVKRRAKKLLDHAPYPMGERFESMVYTCRNSLVKELPRIVGIIDKLKPVLIVIDNFRMAFAGSDTNNNREVTQIMFTLLAISEGTQSAILIADHFKKHTKGNLSESDLQGGSGIKTDLVDGDFFLRKSAQDKNFRVLKRDKSRHFEESDSVKLIKLDPRNLWFDLVAESVNEADHVGIQAPNKDKEEQKDIAQALRVQGKSLDDIAKILGKGKTTIHRWLKMQEGEG